MSSISRLPETTTRLLSSYAVITSPVTLVKELLDNAIDAKATSVDVLMSANTVAKIQVRDDGVGIHPDDYDALGRRGHTSKLRDLVQLRTVAGKSLGFRGEALASANSMANITVTTKTSSEPIAAILHINPGEGGVAKQQPTSAPVGTTVCVTGLFGQIPVREQTMVKEAKKTLDKIQELLRTYAMARPQLRLSFKVLQMPTKNWSYAPNRDATIKEAIIQLESAGIVASCSLKLSTLPSGYTLEAFIVKPDVDRHKAASTHRYFSVDGRPITAKGTMKKILAIYKEHLGDINDPFIRLNIVCPPGNYDANIEPSKDGILFAEEEVGLDGFRSLCTEVYKPIEHGETSTISPAVTLPTSKPPMPVDHQESSPAAPPAPMPAEVHKPVFHQEATPIELVRATAMFNPPMTPDPPILRDPRVTAPGDLGLLPSHTFGHLHNDNPARQRFTVPGGAYRSPISSPAERRPANAPGRGSMKQSRISFNPARAKRSQRPPLGGLDEQRLDERDNARELRAPAKRSHPPSFDEFDEQRFDNGENMQAMRTSAKRNLNYQLSRPEANLSLPVPQQPEYRENYVTQVPDNSVRENPRVREDKEPIKTSLPTGDPRAYLLRRQKSMAAVENSARPAKLRRLKSSLMPLENVLPGEETHCLAWVVNVDIHGLFASTSQMQQYDKYVAEGIFEDGLEMSLEEGRQVEGRLKRLLDSQKENIANAEDGEVGVSLNLGTLLKGKGSAVED
ncbi:Uu.00g042940.m01.CDS01 [Anthostomella pinea]|uniref:Uu.00g042940.m01.CDS01 n=1 Tax=Anthostomella pinea TaxID=933095 RepID=A0AAI8VAP2_9PEZI|nr:Uu.00g042940.m01.CDS01 [Anthostomella pinea]